MSNNLDLIARLEPVVANLTLSQRHYAARAVRDAIAVLGDASAPGKTRHRKTPEITLADAWRLGCEASERSWAYGKPIEENPYLHDPSEDSPND